MGAVCRPVALDHVAFRVADPGEVSRFYRKALGLIEGEGPGGRMALGVPSPHPVPAFQWVLEKGDPGLAHVALSVGSGTDLGGVAATLREEGVPVREAGPDAVAVTDPDGREVQLVRGAELVEPRPAGPVGIERLGHLTMKSPAPHRAAAFYEHLGLRLSERIGDVFFWLRTGPIHHSVAFQKGTDTAVHHLAFGLTDWGEILRAAERLAGIGVPIEFGPGRHMAGRNIFLYFVDPFGQRVELYTGMTEIDDETGYTPIVHDEAARTFSINTWGPRPPESFYA